VSAVESIEIQPQSPPRSIDTDKVLSKLVK
jgi:hypothetical protein